MSDAINEDIIVACADLVGRCGAREFDIGHLHDDVDVADAGWYATAEWQGTRVMTDTHHRSPTAAVLALAQRLMTGAMCKCGQPVTLSDGTPGCRWRLMGRRWKSGCTAPPIHVQGKRGDVAALMAAGEQRRHQSLQQPHNRAQRRAAKRRRK